MNLNQLKYILIQSGRNYKEYESYYGDKKVETIINLNLLKEIHNLLSEAEWYSLPDLDKIYLENLSKKIIVNDDFMIFEVPSNGVYVNWGSSQTSNTFDLI